MPEEPHQLTRQRNSYRDAALAAGKSGNVEGIGNHIADNAVYISDHGLTKGKQAILRAYGEALRGSTLEELELKPEDVEHDGNIVLDSGTAKQTTVGRDGRKTTTNVHYTIVWKLIQNEWKIARLATACAA